MYATLDNTIADINALVVRLVHGEDAEALLEEAQRLLERHNKFVLADLDATVGNRDEARKNLIETYGPGWAPAGNASRAKILERHVDLYSRNNEPLKAAMKPLEEAADSIRQDRWAVEGALKALADWANGEDANLGSLRSEAQSAAYLAFLKQVAEWFAAKQNAGATVEEALRGITAGIMAYGVLHHDNTLSHTYQIRVGDLDEHLGRRAGAHYALQVIAPAGLGVYAAQALGIRREFYRAY